MELSVKYNKEFKDVFFCLIDELAVTMIHYKNVHIVKNLKPIILLHLNCNTGSR